ncbi:MAG: iron-containing alcohol dehydrogenase [Candidatus Omnitrophota bacterium]
MDFPQELLFPQKTIFRKNAVFHLADELKEYGACGLIVHGHSFAKTETKQVILKELSSSLAVDFFCRQTGEPCLDEITAVMEAGRSIGAKWIVGIGGGSVLDLAKAAAGLFHAKEKPVFYQRGGKLEKAGIPFIAIPTTAGTGSEATINSVIIDSAKKVKLSIRDKSFLAKKVVLDVGLLGGLPSDVIRYSGMDALVQAYEAYVSKNASWFSDCLAFKSMELIIKNIISAYRFKDEQSLSEMLLGSYLGGLAFSSARLGVIHGIAHPLGALYQLPHGLICAACLVPSIELNRKAMGKKYALMGRLTRGDFLNKMKRILSELKIVSPFKDKQLIEKEKIISETLQSGSTAANPKNIEERDVVYFLRYIFGKEKL